MVTLLASAFTRGPFPWGDGVFMSRCACGLCTCESMRRLSRNWITVGKPECTVFDFHWFKLCLIAVVILWVTHLCHVYSSCLSFVFFPWPKWSCLCQRVFFSPTGTYTSAARRHGWTGAMHEHTCVRSENQRMDHHHFVCAHTPSVTGEVFDLLRVGQAKGLQSVKQIRLSLLRPVTFYSAAPHLHLADNTGGLPPPSWPLWSCD